MKTQIYWEPEYDSYLGLMRIISAFILSGTCIFWCWCLTCALRWKSLQVSFSRVLLWQTELRLLECDEMKKDPFPRFRESKGTPKEVLHGI